MGQPRLVHNSRHSTTCTVYFNIWDSLAGTKAKTLIGQLVSMGGKMCQIQAAKANLGAALCQQCQQWYHSASGCTAKALSCPECGGTHKQGQHHQVAGCCKGNMKANPPVPVVPMGKPCTHMQCVNCMGNHAANSMKCSFWGHHFDSDWIKQPYGKVRQRRTNSRNQSNPPHVGQ
ncbi:Gag-like protein [Coprinopsis marcescibilis]|uniref:Gag-like protein n=1 Tax=Coprinopsis marcescibilis TaxID=230819 RepID=A0A5C3KXF5_COPMA|nr:Gag-like protein [Coprinopsis marcescibilis]